MPVPAAKKQKPPLLKIGLMILGGYAALVAGTAALAGLSTLLADRDDASAEAALPPLDYVDESLAADVSYSVDACATLSITNRSAVPVFLRLKAAGGVGEARVQPGQSVTQRIQHAQLAVPAGACPIVLYVLQEAVPPQPRRSSTGSKPRTGADFANCLNERGYGEDGRDISDPGAIADDARMAEQCASGR